MLSKRSRCIFSTATESMTYIAKVYQDEKGPADPHTMTSVLVAGMYIPSVDRQQNSSPQNHYLTFIDLGWYLNFGTWFMKNMSIV